MARAVCCEGERKGKVWSEAVGWCVFIAAFHSSLPASSLFALRMNNSDSFLLPPTPPRHIKVKCADIKAPTAPRAVPTAPRGHRLALTRALFCVSRLGSRGHAMGGECWASEILRQRRVAQACKGDQCELCKLTRPLQASEQVGGAQKAVLRDPSLVVARLAINYLIGAVHGPLGNDDSRRVAYGEKGTKVLLSCSFSKRFTCPLPHDLPSDSRVVVVVP